MDTRLLILCSVFALIGCGERQNTQDVQEQYQLPSEQTSQVSPINVPSLIGVSKQVVDKQFGEPECPPKNACIYGENFEVYFVNGSSANLTLPPVDNLASYGLKLEEPEFENPAAAIVRWKTEINGRSAEVSKFENYVYVKTAEP